MSEKLISVIDVAKNANKRKQTIFKIISKLKILTIKENNQDSRGQKIAYITKEDEERIFDYLKNSINLAVDDDENLALDYELHGVFYLIQLEPIYDPGRFKVGFATSIEDRIRKHRCSAPLLKLINTWPCKLLWEKTAIDCVTENCEKIHTEVFRTNEIDNIRIKCDSFFNLMPKL
jgi:hypothetical protein